MQVPGSVAAFLSTVKPPRKLDCFPGYCSPGVRSRNTEQEAPSRLQPGPLQSVRSRVYSQDARSAPPWPGHPQCRAPPTSQDTSGSAGQVALTWAWPLLRHLWLHLFCSPTDSEAETSQQAPLGYVHGDLATGPLVSTHRGNAYSKGSGRTHAPGVHVCTWNTHTSFFLFFSESFLFYTGV